MYVDLGPAELHTYRPTLHPPAGLRRFWTDALSEGDGVALDIEREPRTDGWRTVKVEDIRYTASDGRRLRAWLVTPQHLARNDTCVVEFPGYGGGRRDPADSLFWSAIGCAHLLVDVRDQGGNTADPANPTVEATDSGFLVRGVTSPHTSYYRQVMIDATRAVDVARALTGSAHVVTAGVSQGGGLALAAAALGDAVAAVLADVPFLCHLRRAITVTDEGPYAEVAKYLAVRRGDADTVLNTLDHIDVAHLAAWGRPPAFFSAALMDPVVPPSTVVAARRAWAGPTELQLWPFNAHEGGGAEQRQLQVRWLRTLGLLDSA